MKRGVPSVRAETIALARKRARAAGSLTTESQLDAEHQVYLLKSVCRHLWGLLDRRRGNGIVTSDEIWDGLTSDAKAAVDRTYEAMMALWARDRIHVEPCRRIIDGQLQAHFRYLLVLPGGEQRVIEEETLLMMAGVE